MSIVNPGPRRLTELDHVRLVRLTGEHPQDALSDLLDAAHIVPSADIDPDVVTMYSQVLVTAPETGEQRQLTVCYPDDAEPKQGFISVLSPVGAAMLGQRVGALVTSLTPGGQSRLLHINAILFQPEATGDYVT